MALSAEALQMLMLLERPAFFAENGMVTHANEQAKQLNIAPGGALDQLLSIEEVSSAHPVILAGKAYTLQASDIGGATLYTLTQQEGREALEALNLAACNLRTPLFTMLNALEMVIDGDESYRGTLYKNYYQVHRTICNMSDAARYAYWRSPKPTLTNAKAFMDELMEKIRSKLPGTELTIQYTGLDTPLFCSLDQELVERAVHNLVSNSMKAGSHFIQIRFTKQGNILHLSVYDDGCGIPPDVRSNMYQCFLREPGITSSRYGLGLGMVIIRAAAAAHQGTVLVEQNPDMGLHVTMTFTITAKEEMTLKQHSLRVDYLGGLDHTLIELSDVLPPKEFIK